jgi:phospholipid:diacylglycerol acyltransferase
VRDQVWLYFMNWVERLEPGWVDKYIDSFVCMGSPLLGAPSALPRMISGEIKEFYDFGQTLADALDR